MTLAEYGDDWPAAVTVPEMGCVCAKARAPLNVPLPAADRVYVPEPVNGVEVPLTFTDPLKLTFAVKPWATMLAIPVCMLKFAGGGGGTPLPFPPPPPQPAKARPTDAIAPAHARDIPLMVDSLDLM